MAEVKTLTATVRGIPVSVEREALNDIEVMELLGELQDGNPLVLPKLMRAVYGAEQYANIKASLREGGRTSSEAVAAFFRESFVALGEEAKNSQSSPATGATAQEG